MAVFMTFTRWSLTLVNKQREHYHNVYEFEGAGANR